jgi:hypothetical protein
MADMTDDELFHIDPDFVKKYNFFPNKYATEGASFSIRELVGDLRSRLGCRLAALIQFDERSDKVVSLYKDPDVGIEPLMQEDTIKCIHTLLEQDQFSGETIVLDRDIEAKRRKVDLIPMPRLAGEKETPFDQFFLIVDSFEKDPLDSTEHKSERMMLSQFLCGWWVRATAPKFGSGLHVTNEEEMNRFKRLWQKRRYIAAPSTLIEEGKRSAGTIRRREPGKTLFFEGELERTGEFDWKEWTPLKPGTDKLERARKDTELLVYWCRWMDSHHDLEREQASSIPNPVEQNNDENPALDKNLKQPQDVKNNPGVEKSVTDWLKQRREKEEIKKIADQLNSLRKAAAKESIGEGGEATLEALPIGARSLLSFSLNHWLEPEGWLRRNLVSGSFGDIEFCRALHGVAVTAHYLLGDPPPTEDEVILRIMQLIAQYGHGDLGIPSRIDLRAHMLQEARGEPALHSLKQYYRDHFFHAIEVCFLGHVLLETSYNRNRYLWQLVAKYLGLKGNRAEVRRTVLRLWYLAALLHDVGYAMDLLNSSRKFLDFFENSAALRSLCKSFADAVRNLSTEKELAKVGISKKRRERKDNGTGEEHGIGEDHGVIGALHLQTLLEHIQEEDPDVHPDEFKPAVEAIALHNLRKHEDEISFIKQPLAFLLALCDQLQEWQRPQLPFATSPNWILARLRGTSIDSDNIEGGFKNMQASITGRADLKGGIHLRFMQKPGKNPCLVFEIVYGDRINRNSGVFSTWLGATLNFQRLNFDGLPLDIRVKYITPFFDNEGHNVPQPQMHRLRSVAHETHMAFLIDWFPDAKKTIDGIEYLTNDSVMYRVLEKNREELTLNLKKLAGKAIMTKGMGAFRERLKEWKHYNDDRDFPGDYASVIPG